MRGLKRKSKKDKFKIIIIVSCLFIILFCISFFAGSYVGKNRSLVVSGIKTSENINDEIQFAKLSNKKENKKNIEKVIDPYKADGKKIAYLTFDDGPSSNLTPQILDVLKKYEVKATFFLIGTMANENSGLVKRQKSEGHSVCIHSYSHDYDKIYSSTDSFLEDIRKCEMIIKSILGDEYENKLIRFPGGSFGNKLNPYKEAVKKDGYRYVDWNSLNGDAESNYVPVNKLISRLKETAAGQEHLVVLMHDAPAKETTVQALPSIIQYLKINGYEFKVLY